MEHRLARRVIGAMADSAGLGPRTNALLLSAMLPETGAPAELVERCFERAEDLPHDVSLTGSAYTLDGEPGSDRQAFLDRFGSVMIDYSRDPAVHLEWLFLLDQLWGHCNRRERCGLLLLWLDLVHGTPGEEGSYITREDLRRWQRNQLTSNDTADLSPSTLEGMFDEEDPAAAYSILANHLGLNTRPSDICWVLGTLMVRILLHTFDHDGRLLRHFSASACCCPLAQVAPPEVMVSAISQLHHGIWWSYRHRSRRHLTHCPDNQTGDLTTAILTGDIIRSEALARQCYVNVESFWSCIHRSIIQILARPGRYWVRALRGVIAVLIRCRDGRPTPDDAAVLAAVLATVCFQQGSDPRG